MNFQAFDSEKELHRTKINIHVIKRNGRKADTIISGWDDDLDLKRICSHMKTKFSCSGNVIKDEKTGQEIIKLTGTQNEKVIDFLISHNIYQEEDIIVQGL